MRRCLAAWAQLLSLRRELWAAVEALAAARFTARVHAAIRAWRGMCVRLREAAAAAEVLSVARGRRRLRAMHAAWREHAAAERQRLCDALRVANALCCRTLTRRSFTAWREALELHLQNQAVAEASAAKQAAAGVQRSFDAWREDASSTAERRRLCETACAAAYSARQQGAAFSCWHRLCVQLRKARAAAEEQAAACAFQRQRAALLAWRKHAAADVQWLSDTESTADALSSRVRMRRSLAAWKDFLKLQQGTQAGRQGHGGTACSGCNADGAEGLAGGCS